MMCGNELANNWISKGFYGLQTGFVLFLFGNYLQFHEFQEIGFVTM